MTDDEIRAIILERVMGWQRKECVGRPYLEGPMKGDFVLTFWLDLPYQPGPYFAPDLLNDLNAIHEAEARLTEAQCSRYADELMIALFPDTHLWRIDRMDYMDVYRIAHATARQRAEALVRAITQSDTPITASDGGAG